MAWPHEIRSFGCFPRISGEDLIRVRTGLDLSKIIQEACQGLSSRFPVEGLNRSHSKGCHTEHAVEMSPHPRAISPLGCDKPEIFTHQTYLILFK